MNWRFAEVRWRLLPGGLTALLFAGLLKLGALQPLEQIAYQSLFRSRGETRWDDRLVLVKIDDASIKKLGRFPWSRQKYVKLLDQLRQADASIVAFDLLFSESTLEDKKFSAAIERSQRVVLAQGEEPSGLPLLPVPLLRDPAIGSGHIRTVASADGIVRTIDPYSRNELAFGIATVKAYSFVRQAVPLPDLKQALWLNWIGSMRTLQQYSFADVTQGKVNPAVFQNKIVLVGITEITTDTKPTPFDQDPPAHGIHIQATLIHNLLQQNTLQIVDGIWIGIILGVLGIGFSVFLSFWRTRTQIIVAIVASLGWLGLSVGLLKVNLLMPVAFPIGMLMVGVITTALIERWRINLILQTQVRQLWQQYQSDLVLRPVPESEDLIQSLPMIASMQRITQLTALAEQFGRSQSTQAAIARSLSIGLVAADMDGLVWFCNPIAMDLLKVQVGSRLENALVPEWLSPEEWDKTLGKLRAHHAVVPREHAVSDQTGWFCLKFEPLHDPMNHTRLDGLLILLEDITARKMVEANLDRQIEELHRMSQLKDDFLSTVSHELRTPLTNMKMAIQLLQIAKAEDQRTHYLKILESECTRETELINELLDLQRLEAGQHIVNPELLDLYTRLPELVEPFYRRTEARQQKLTVSVNSNLPCMKTDRASVERIIVELVNNACKYTPPNHEILVSAAWAEPYIELTVSNSGVEIPEKERSKIFERFYRVPQADPWKQGGTGLGLALVKKLVERLYGKIEVISRDDWTAFLIHLPLDYERAHRSR